MSANVIPRMFTYTVDLKRIPSVSWNSLRCTHPISVCGKKKPLRKHNSGERKTPFSQFHRLTRLIFTESRRSLIFPLKKLLIVILFVETLDLRTNFSLAFSFTYDIFKLIPFFVFVGSILIFVNFV